MKTTFVMLATMALAGCMTSDDAINPRGSYPDLTTGSAEARDRGTLEVRTSAIDAPDREAKDTLREHLPRYVVYDESGRRVAEVRNRMDAEGSEKLEALSLPSGRYLVRIDERDAEPSAFWVTVQPNQITRVDADAAVREAR